jgi:hypothetical protein
MEFSSFARVCEKGTERTFSKLLLCEGSFISETAKER